MPKTEFKWETSDSAIDYKSPDCFGAYYIEMNIESYFDERFAVRFLDDKFCGCELQLDFGRKQAQFATIKNENMCDSITPFHIAVKDLKNVNKFNSVVTMPYEYIPYKGRNFSIAYVPYKKDNTLRIMMYYHNKMDTTVIDVEINGVRTMITNRSDLLVDRVATISNSEVILKHTKFYVKKII